MRYHRFGRLGWQVSDIGYGMWGMGGWTGSDDRESHGSLDRAVELGCNFFDTAFAYGMGRSEKLLGELLSRHRARRLHVTTKVPPKNWKWPGRAETPITEVFPPEHIREFTEKSLENLGVRGLPHRPTDRAVCRDRSPRIRWHGRGLSRARTTLGRDVAIKVLPHLRATPIGSRGSNAKRGCSPR